MVMELFALNENIVRAFVNGVRQATERQDRARWRVVYETIHRFRPRPSLVFGTHVDPPYTEGSSHTNPAASGGTFRRTTCPPSTIRGSRGCFGTWFSKPLTMCSAGEWSVSARSFVIRFPSRE